MATIQIRDVPDDVYETIRERARRAGQSLPAYMRDQVVAQGSRPTSRELLEDRVRELHARPTGVTAEEIVRILPEGARPLTDLVLDAVSAWSAEPARGELRHNLSFYDALHVACGAPERPTGHGRRPARARTDASVQRRDHPLNRHGHVLNRRRVSSADAAGAFAGRRVGEAPAHAYRVGATKAGAIG